MIYLFSRSRYIDSFLFDNNIFVLLYQRFMALVLLQYLKRLLVRETLLRPRSNRTDGRRWLRFRHVPDWRQVTRCTFEEKNARNKCESGVAARVVRRGKAYIRARAHRPPSTCRSWASGRNRAVSVSWRSDSATLTSAPPQPSFRRKIPAARSRSAATAPTTASGRRDSGEKTRISEMSSV